MCRVCAAGALRFRLRPPSATRARRAAISSAWGTSCSPSTTPLSPSASALLYWFITWQFQSLVSTEEISLGKIDKLGIETSLWEVLQLMPLYLLQGMITSIGLTALLVGLLATLIWYVDAIDRPGLRGATPPSWSSEPCISWRTWWQCSPCRFWSLP